MLKALLVLLFVDLTLAASRQLVPHINAVDQYDVGFRLEPNVNSYNLNIQHDSSSRVETVQEIAPGELLVNGRLHNLYSDENGQLDVIYEAGRNGYKAKYSYVTLNFNVPPPLHLPASVLKAAAG